MAFDRNLAPELCKKLQQGVAEEVIAAYHGITLPELYNLVDFENGEIARKYLKHFCNGYINYVCLCWPNCDEHICKAFGYTKDCPMEK